VFSPGEGGSDDSSDGPTVLQSNPPLSGKALLYQQFLESKKNDTTMNVPGDYVVTDVIPPGGGGSHNKSDGPAVLPSNSSLCGKTLLYQQYLEKGKGGSTGLENQHQASPPNTSIMMFSPCICTTSFQMSFIF
jgi:hypothetical protein